MEALGAAATNVSATAFNPDRAQTSAAVFAAGATALTMRRLACSM
jgi:hypothetical protein